MVRFRILALVTLCILLSFSSYSQTYDKPGNYGLQYKRVKADSSLKVPILTDTVRLSTQAGNGDIIYVQSPTGTPDTGFWGIEKGAYVKISGQEVDGTSYINRDIVDDTNVVWMVSAIIQPNRDTNTNINSWRFTDDNDHKPLNCSTVTTTATAVRIWFSQQPYKIGAFIVGPDESTIYALNARYKSTDPLYNNGGYKCGARLTFDYAEVYFSKPARVAWNLLRDSTNATWTQGQYTPNIFNLASTPFTINNSTNYFDIRSESLIEVKGAPTFHVSFADGNTKYALDVRYERATNFWYRVWVTDPSGAIVPVASIPHNTQLIIDYGEVDVPVNPQTEKFAPSANFCAIGLMYGAQ